MDALWSADDSVVVGVDGSSDARRALDWALGLAARSRALLIIAMNIAWKRGSSVSSGWKALASTEPSRTATG